MRHVAVVHLVVVSLPLHHGEGQHGRQHDQDGRQDDEALRAAGELLGAVDVAAEYALVELLAGPPGEVDGGDAGGEEEDGGHHA